MLGLVVIKVEKGCRHQLAESWTILTYVTSGSIRLHDPSSVSVKGCRMERHKILAVHMFDSYLDSGEQGTCTPQLAR